MKLCAEANMKNVGPELHRLLIIAERGLEDAVNYWGLQDDVPTDVEVRESTHAGLAAIRGALNVLASHNN